MKFSRVRVGQAISGMHSMVVMKQVIDTLRAHVTRKSGNELYPIKGRQTHVKRTVAEVLSSIPCACASMNQRHPGLLQGGQDHVVLRTRAQWGRILTPMELQCATQNARNVTLPSKQFIQDTVQRLHTASVFLSDVADAPIIDDATITNTIDRHRAQYTRQFPRMCPDVFMRINKKLRNYGLQAGTWDKEPCKVQATCSVHMQRQLAYLTVTDPNFHIIGVQTEAQGARAYVIRETLMSAARKGILGLASDLGLWPKSLLTEEGIRAGLPTLCSSCAAPSAFHLLKWKTAEEQCDWRFRLAIVHTCWPPLEALLQADRTLPYCVVERTAHCLPILG